MSLTLKQQMEKVTSLKHRQAVWEAVFAYLDENFITKDEGRGNVKAIRATDCLPELVPEEVVEEVIQAVGESITTLKLSIEEIENQKLTVIREDSK
jgi:hypothetical protein